MSRHFSRWISLAVVAIVAFSLPARAQNVLTLRVESMDALIEDIDAIAVALGQEPGTGKGLVEKVAGQLGLTHLDMIDGKNPLVVALPLQGMMLGQQGFVGAFPVTDVDAAVAAMKAAKEGVTVDENGLLHMPMGEAGELLLLPSDGYMIYGRNANLVGGFNPGDLLAGTHLPPGTVAAEFNVDSMRAMIGMTLEGVRQQIAGTLAQTGEEGGEAVDPEAAAAISNTAVNWIQALVANTRAVQLSLQVTDSHVVLHNHYLPVAASTLGEFLKVQKGGMPDIARLLDGKDSSMAFVANVKWTDEAVAAFEDFMDGYAALLQNTMKNQEGAAQFAEWMPAMMRQYQGLWNCMRGDMAQVFDMSDGMRFVQVSGIKDEDGCRDLSQRVGQMIGSMPEGAGEFLTFSPGVFSHNGTQVARMSFDVEGLAAVPEESAADVKKVWQGMFGDEGFNSYMASARGLLIGTGGAEGEEAMRATLDRVAGGKSGSGIPESTFAPFDVGAGVYVSMDFGKFFSGMKGMLPDADGETSDEVQRVMEALGTITGAAEFQSDALALKVAMGTSGLSTIGEKIREKAAAKTEHDEAEAEAEEHDD